MRELVIDVSKWDGDVDFSLWTELRDLWGVVIKGGGSDVGRYVDSWFARNYDKARAAGVHVGAYYYSAAMSVSEAIDDADHFCDECLDGREWDLPAYIDVEERSQFTLSRGELTRIACAFMDRLQERGHRAGVYTGGSAFCNSFETGRLYDYADWVASWSADWPSYAGEPGEIGMWQQGGIRLADGDVVYDDVPGYTDCDWCAIDYPATMNGGSGLPEPAATTTPTGSVEDVMREAYADLGYYAPDDPERGSKAGRYMAELTGEEWMAGPSWEIWWCCMWVSMVLDKAGVRCAGFPSQNTDVALNNGARAHLVDKSQIRRGDVLIFDWNWSTDATDHIGFATGSPYGGYVPTIEGNVGNAVAERQRALSTIRYVVRPDYDGQEATPRSDVVRPDYEADLVIDGSVGHLTVHKWQSQMGTYADGVISGQDADHYRYRRNVYSIEHDGGSGSQLVEAIQAKVGASIDGIWGPETSRKVQEWLIDHGYGCGPAGADDHFGHDSACALQRSLNDGAWS